MPTEKPAAPEGCVYGPWWDEQSNSWLCIKEREDHSLVMLWKNHMVENWQRSSDRDGYKELLKIAEINKKLLEGLERADKDMCGANDSTRLYVKALIAECRNKQ